MIARTLPPPQFYVPPLPPSPPSSPSPPSPPPFYDPRSGSEIDTNRSIKVNIEYTGNYTLCLQQLYTSLSMQPSINYCAVPSGRCDTTPGGWCYRKSCEFKAFPSSGGPARYSRYCDQSGNKAVYCMDCTECFTDFEPSPPPPPPPIVSAPAPPLLSMTQIQTYGVVRIYPVLSLDESVRLRDGNTDELVQIGTLQNDYCNTNPCWIHMQVAANTPIDYIIMYYTFLAPSSSAEVYVGRNIAGNWDMTNPHLPVEDRHLCGTISGTLK